MIAPAPPHLRRNFRLGVLNGAMFMLSETLSDPGLVVAWFLANLSASNFLIGLIVPLRDAGWFLPQLFISRRLGGLAFKMPMYRDMAIVRTGAWIVIVAAVFIVRSPGVLIAVFVLAYMAYALAAGVAGLPFMSVTAKTIPLRQRGRYFGERLFWGGLLSIGASYLVKVVLEDRPGLGFPANVGLLMLLTTLTAAIGMMLFIATIEPPDPVLVQAGSLREHLRLAFQLPGRDREFRRFLAARVALIIGGLAIPFLAVYATRTLAAGPGMIGIYLGIRTAASLASNRLWGRWVDQYGGRVVMQSSAIQILVAMAIALVLAPLAHVAGLPRSAWPWLFAPVFVLTGSATSAIGIAGTSLTLNLAPDEQRDIYMGLANTVLGAATLLTALGGLVADLAGYEGVFALSAVCSGIGLVVAARMKG